MLLDIFVPLLYQVSTFTPRPLAGLHAHGARGENDEALRTLTAVRTVALPAHSQPQHMQRLKSLGCSLVAPECVC